MDDQELRTQARYPAENWPPFPSQQGETTMDTPRDTHFEVFAQLLYHDLLPYLRDDIPYAELERLLTRRGYDLAQHVHIWRSRKKVADIPPLTNWPPAT